MKKITMLILSASLLLAPLNGLTAYADTETTAKPEPIKAPLEEKVLTLSLQEAIDYGLLNNKEMEIQKLELEKAEISYTEGKRSIRTNKDIMEAEKFLPAGETSYFIAPEAQINISLIDNGGTMKQVELALNSAKMNVVMKENQIKYNIEKGYFDFLQKEKELLISNENLALSQKQYNNAKLRYDLGMISKQQLLQMELGLGQAKSGNDAAKMMLEIQKLSLKTTLGLPLDKEIKLTGEIAVKKYEPIDLKESIKEALEKNAGIIVAKEMTVIQPLILKATSGRYPQVTFRYKKQEVEVAKAEESLRQAMVGVEMGVRTSILNLKTSEEQIATFQKAVTMAGETVKIAELSFQLGQNTPADVQEANINLMNAKNNLAKQIHAFNMALLDYKYSIGLGKGM